MPCLEPIANFTQVSDVTNLVSFIQQTIRRESSPCRYFVVKDGQAVSELEERLVPIQTDLFTRNNIDISVIKLTNEEALLVSGLIDNPPEPTALLIEAIRKSKNRGFAHD
jgi:hypothetical protein